MSDHAFRLIYAGIDAATRLVKAAKRLDDYHACRLGAVVSDEDRRAIYAEHSAAVAAALPFFVPEDGGNAHGADPVAPAGVEGKAA